MQLIKKTRISYRISTQQSAVLWSSMQMTLGLKLVYTQVYALHCAVQLHPSSRIHAFQMYIYCFLPAPTSPPQLTECVTHFHTCSNFSDIIFQCHLRDTPQKSFDVLHLSYSFTVTASRKPILKMNISPCSRSTPDEDSLSSKQIPTV